MNGGQDVIHHVSGENRLFNCNSFTSLASSSDSKVLRLFALGGGGGRTAQNISRIESLTVRSGFETDLQQLNFSVNPFALIPPELEEYESYTKGI